MYQDAHMTQITLQKNDGNQAFQARDAGLNTHLYNYRRQNNYLIFHA
jgi:hypothetical protein